MAFQIFSNIFILMQGKRGILVLLYALVILSVALESVGIQTQLVAWNSNISDLHSEISMDIYYMNRTHPIKL